MGICTTAHEPESSMLCTLLEYSGGYWASPIVTVSMLCPSSLPTRESRGASVLLEQRQRRETVSGIAERDASAYAGNVVLPSASLHVSSWMGIRTRIWKCLLFPSAGPIRARIVIY
jgi:hypothetical protein